ncbi:hypothetical protein PFISCL1PPCAC_23351, partial [Pristionchus fissidentatus]
SQEPRLIRARIPDWRPILDSFTTLHKIWLTADAQTEMGRAMMYGPLFLAQNPSSLRPIEEFAYNYNVKYCCLVVPDSAIINDKMGPRLAVSLTPLVKEVEMAVKKCKTYCPFC